MSKLNILIASVGGQGGLTLSRVIATAAVNDGLSVRTGETLGMSQRFGSVISFVRVGGEESVRSPTFGLGEADVLIGLELTESVRALKYLRRGGKAFVTKVIKPPITASIGSHRMPGREELLNVLRREVPELVVVPAKEIAVKSGNVRAVNMVMLGVANYVLKFLSSDSVRRAILTILPGRRGETSVKAYEAGIKWARRNVAGKP